jgi:hypothetical protein
MSKAQQISSLPVDKGVAEKLAGFSSLLVRSKQETR